MPAPKRPNTAAATIARIRAGQGRAAERLRAAGWDVTPPAHDLGGAADEMRSAIRAIEAMRQAHDEIRRAADEMRSAIRAIEAMQASVSLPIAAATAAIRATADMTSA